jgi:hypothetical protein
VGIGTRRPVRPRHARPPLVDHSLTTQPNRARPETTSGKPGQTG